MLFYLFAYMFTTMGTFSMIILLTRQGFRGDHIADFAGLGRTHPLPAFIFIVFFLSLAGIPPTAGFVGQAVNLPCGHRRRVRSGWQSLAWRPVRLRRITTSWSSRPCTWTNLRV